MTRGLKILFHFKNFIVPLKSPYLYNSLLQVQGGPSGRGTLFVEIKFKVLSQYKLLRLKCNCQFEVNIRLSSTRWTTLYVCYACMTQFLSVLAESKIALDSRLPFPLLR